GRVLVLKHATGSWVFPKGHLERGESELQAAIREVEEEAGVSAWCVDPAVSWATEYVNPRGSRRLITRLALGSDDAARLSEALFEEAAYLEPDVALARLSHEADRRHLGEVVTALDPVTPRRRGAL